MSKKDLWTILKQVLMVSDSVVRNTLILIGSGLSQSSWPIHFTPLCLPDDCVNWNPGSCWEKTLDMWTWWMVPGRAQNRYNFFRFSQLSPFQFILSLKSLDNLMNVSFTGWNNHEVANRSFWRIKYSPGISKVSRCPNFCPPVETYLHSVRCCVEICPGVDCMVSGWPPSLHFPGLLCNSRGGI